VDPVELGTPRTARFEGPTSSSHVCQRLTLFEPVSIWRGGLGEPLLGDIACDDDDASHSAARPSMGRTRTRRGRAVRRVGAPRLEVLDPVPGEHSGEHRAHLCLQVLGAQDVEGPEHHVVRRPPSRRSAVAPQVVTLPSVSHKKMASSDSSTTARRTSAGSGSRSVPAAGPTAPSCSPRSPAARRSPTPRLLAAYACRRARVGPCGVCALARPVRDGRLEPANGQPTGVSFSWVMSKMPVSDAVFGTTIEKFWTRSG